jgi:diaminohydroxyphosphoribosylaminopyrimidine deaminase/5-amino-6-(5-phosphoribosylamino)uracil reductase
MATCRELDAMRRAIALSAFGLGTTSPNPPVGCVILDADGHLVSEGYHERKGEPHAEAQALAAAAERARGGIAIVTLEPCNHQGRTPPCRQALIDAGIARVVISVIDPTSRGEGGAAALRNAGLNVEVGILDHEARLVLGPWMAALEHGRPFITLVYTVDPGGEISGLPSADRASSPESVMDAHDLRITHDAVLLSNRRLEESMPNQHGREVFAIPTNTPQEMNDLLVSLVDGGVRSLLVDGGCSLANSFLDIGVVDHAVAYLESGGPSNTGPATTDAQRFAGLIAGFVLHDVARVGRAVRVSSGPPR